MQRTVQPIRAQIRFARAKGRCKKTSCKSKRLHVKSQGLLPVRSAAPLCMDVCIIVPPHTPVWPCVPLCTSVYPCQTLCTPVYPCIPLCTPVYPCVPLCMHTYCVPLWTPVHTCLPLFTPVYPCVPLCTPMYPCVPRCTPVSPCVPLYTYPCKKKSPPPYLSSGVLPRMTRTFDVYPLEGFLRHRSSCLALRVDRARAGGVRARGETREGRGAMRDILRKNLISPKPRKRPLAVVKTELPAWREMRPSQSFEQKFRAPPAPPNFRLKPRLRGTRASERLARGQLAKLHFWKSRQVFPYQSNSQNFFKFY